MSAPEDPRNLLGRVLSLEQQVIDLRARLDREHQAGEGFLRFSERTLRLDDLGAFWELATEEALTTFGTENALLLRWDGDDASVCGSCCADGVTPDELTALARCARRALAERALVLDAAPLPSLMGQATSVMLVGGFRDRGDADRTYALVATVSVARQPFYPTFDATLGPLYAAFVNHLGALQQHIRSLIEARRVAQQLKRLADVANRTSNAVVIMNREGSIEWVNDGFGRLTGYSLDEVVGLGAGSFVERASDDPEARQRMGAALARLEPFDLEVRNHARSGREYWAQIETRVTYDDSGEPSGFVALATDVTEQRMTSRREGLAQRVAAMLLASGSRAEGCERVVGELVGALGVQVAQIWATEQNQTTLVHVAGASSALAGEAGERLLAVSRSLPFARGPEAVHGIGLPGKAWHFGRTFTLDDITRPSPGEGLSRRMDAAIDAGVVVLCVAPILGPDRVLGVIEVGSTRAHPGNPLLPAILERVAEQVASFMVHDLSRRAFRSVFEHSPDALLLVDGESRVQAANARAGALFGATAGLALGALLDGGEGLVRDAIAVDATGAMLDGGTLFSRTARGLGGASFAAEVSVALTPSLSGPSAIIAVRDVTEHHRMEAALTQSLREKETLLKEIHHRVKNNLQIISSLLTLQIEQMPSDRARMLLTESVHRVRSMALIHQHLYGTHSLERIEVGTYTRQLAEALRSALAPGARLRVDADAVELTIEQAVPIGLILNELLTNAFKYGLRTAPDRPDGADVVVTITLTGRRVEMTVRDHGAGLPEGFVPARATTLGLKMVRTLVRQLGGTLVVESVGGARFVISFALESASSG